QFVRSVLPHDSRETRAGADNRDAVDALAYFVGVVVDEADRRRVVPGVELHIADDQLASIARAVDQYTLASAACSLQQVAIDAPTQPEPAHDANEQHRIDD